MFSQLKQRCLSLLVCLAMGLSLSLLAANYNALHVAANEPPTIEERSAVTWERQGHKFYSLERFDRAVEFWERAVKIYATKGEILARSRVLGNLALAYARLGAWQQAKNNIAVSLELLNSNTELDEGKRTKVLAQVLNNRGVLQLTTSQTEAAIASWQEALDNYRTVGDKAGAIRATLNLANAYKNIGLYRRALKTLRQITAELKQQPDSAIKAAGLRSYGEINRIVGNYERSRQILERSLAIATKIDASSEKVKTLLALGNTWEVINDNQQALELYYQGLKICYKDLACKRSELPLQINLAQFNLLLETKYWWRSIALIPEIKSRLVTNGNRTNLYQQINFARNLVELRQRKRHASASFNTVPTWAEIAEIIANANSSAVALGDRRAESYTLGFQGQIYEQQQQWDKARLATEKASQIALEIDAPEINYLWQWQLGRISQARQDRESAIAHYTGAVEAIKLLSQNLAAINSDLQYSFRDSVEPIYRGLVSLLLSNSAVGQTDLERARNVIESLQIAELNNFFREACLDAQPIKIESLDSKAAIIYPIILEDRLEVILSLPGKPLRQYTTAISSDKLETIIERFKQDIVVRSRRNFYTPASQLYDLLIRPAAKDLAGSGVDNLIFVPDGALRNIPLAALYDGREYLIEQYRVSMTPSLQLLAPRSLDRVKFKTVAAGLSEPTQGFSGLNYVNRELSAIKAEVSNGSVVLMNDKFTSQALEREIKFTNYPIVHIATHGQFSSSLEDTFLLAWNSKIQIGELEHILQTRTPTSQKAIELLVLSACETAAGDKRAALGLAGIAVRAGAKSTLATLWSVNDLTTAELMSQFYQELTTKNTTKTEAIRQAQLSLLHSRWHRHPYYWAPYVLLGNWL